jgi:hypothetical protein
MARGPSHPLRQGNADVCWASPFASWFAATTGRIEFVILRTGSSPPVALHLPSRGRSCVRLRGPSPASTGTLTPLVRYTCDRTSGGLRPSNPACGSMTRIRKPGGLRHGAAVSEGNGNAPIRATSKGVSRAECGAISGEATRIPSACALGFPATGHEPLPWRKPPGLRIRVLEPQAACDGLRPAATGRDGWDDVTRDRRVTLHSIPECPAPRG